MLGVLLRRTITNCCRDLFQSMECYNWFHWMLQVKMLQVKMSHKFHPPHRSTGFWVLCILEGFNNITCVLGMACSYWCKLGGIFLATGTLLSRLCHWQVAGKLWVVGGRQKPLLQLETVFCAEYPNFLTRNRCRKPSVKGEHGSPAPGNLLSGLAQKMGLAWQPLSAVFLFSGSAAKIRET